ncbi:hypothetical protein AVEN_180232-1 [Araneus ventricosus]|uniref:Uncharacterized protein n=1 Tax=Araneus ventricosus TaxID=182803 RepID=A0A4Y2VA15_ARAVE|nr:hypothetical protein AVEN_180232-1 [Araneus ventricosus]
MSMTTPFHTGYKIAFDTDEYPLVLFFSCISGAYSLSHILLIMVPASISNEAAKRAKRVVMSLPSPTNDEELKFEIQKCFFQENFLSLWNIYSLDRSLIITAFGTLLTYGILLATLGKEH